VLGAFIVSIILIV